MDGSEVEWSTMALGPTFVAWTSRLSLVAHFTCMNSHTGCMQSRSNGRFLCDGVSDLRLCGESLLTRLVVAGRQHRENPEAPVLDSHDSRYNTTSASSSI